MNYYDSTDWTGSSDRWVDPARLVGPALALAAEAPGQSAIQFRDATAETNITFRHQSGAFGQKDLPETMGAGTLVANYVTWTVETDLFCTLDGKTKSYCTPESYEGESPTTRATRPSLVIANFSNEMIGPPPPQPSHP